MAIPRPGLGGPAHVGRLVSYVLREQTDLCLGRLPNNLAGGILVEKDCRRRTADCVPAEARSYLTGLRNSQDNCVVYHNY